MKLGYSRVNEFLIIKETNKQTERELKWHCDFLKREKLCDGMSSLWTHCVSGGATYVCPQKGNNEFEVSSSCVSGTQTQMH